MIGRKNKKVKRLKDMKPFEVAIVPRGANRSPFVVLKEDGSMKLDLAKLTEMQTTLSRVVTVCKSGTPAAETVDTLSKDLHSTQAILAEILGDSSKAKDNADIKKHVEEINTLAEGLTESTFDLNVQDQIDTLLERVKVLTKSLDAGETVVDDADKKAEDKVDVKADAAADVKADDKVDADKKADADVKADAAEADDKADDKGDKATDADKADDAATKVDADAKADDAAADDAKADDAVADDAKADDAATAEVVTKADLSALGTSIVDGFKEAMGTLVTTIKSDSGRPQLMFPAGMQDLNAGTKADDEGANWGNQFDINAEED
jgi:hypothetical protein